MSSDTHDCCRCSGKMCKGRHDFMARVGNEIVVIKDVPALICDTCGEVEYTLEISREIDVIRTEFFAGRLLAKPLAAGENGIQAPAGRFDGMSNGLHTNPCKIAICRGDETNNDGEHIYLQDNDNVRTIDDLGQLS